MKRIPISINTRISVALTAADWFRLLGAMDDKLPSVVDKIADQVYNATE